MYGSVQAGSVTEVHAISRVEGRSSHRRRASPGTTMAAGAGCLRFRTLDEIAEAVREINADYKAHCQAAFEIAAEFFEAEKVLALLLERTGI
jgi:hypothetical protein